MQATGMVDDHLGAVTSRSADDRSGHRGHRPAALVRLAHRHRPPLVEGRRGGRGHRLHGRARRAVRAARPQRRRQDHDDQDAHHAAAADVGHAPGCSATTSSTTPREVRRRVGYVFGGDRGLYERLSGLDNLRYFAELYGVPPREQKARIGELLELVGLDRPRAGAGRGLLAGHAAAAAHRPRPAARARRCCSSTSRASASTRSAPASCGTTVADPGRARHDRAAHDALHVRGRRAVRPHRRHRRRPDRRRGHARRSSRRGSATAGWSRSRCSACPTGAGRRARAGRRALGRGRGARPGPGAGGPGRARTPRSPRPVLGCLDRAAGRAGSPRASRRLEDAYVELVGSRVRHREIVLRLLGDGLVVAAEDAQPVGLRRDARRSLYPLFFATSVLLMYRAGRRQAALRQRRGRRQRHGRVVGGRAPPQRSSLQPSAGRAPSSCWSRRRRRSRCSSSR